MPNMPSKVLIVDDSPTDIHVLLSQIGSNFQVTAATSAAKTLDMLRSGNIPDIILMDVCMPDMDGYEACATIKNDVLFRDIDIIFVSANDDPQEIIKGIGVGAIDYIVKPFNSEVIQSKLRRVIEYGKQKSVLAKKADDATKMLYSVMSEAGSQGVVLNFLRGCFDVNESKALLDLTLETLTQAGLKGVVFFKQNHIEEVGANGEKPGFLELDLIDRVFGGQQPLLHQKKHLLVTRGSSVIYIKNFPEEDIKAGILRDSLMILIDGLNSKLSTLCDKALYDKRGEEVKSVVDQAQKALSSIRQNQADHKAQSMAMLDDMVQQIEKGYFSLGLTDEQEDALSSTMHIAVDKSLDHFEKGLAIDTELQLIIDKLSKIAS